MSRVCALWNLGSKGQRSRSQCKDYWKWFQANNWFPFTPIFMKTSHAVSPWVEYGPYGLWGQKVKGQGYNARITENGFWRITASPFHRSSWNLTCNLPMSRVWTLWTLGSKGQRSRLQCKDYWKWFLAHNCFPLPQIFMKLNMQSPHESSMVLGSKGQRSRSQFKDCWKWFWMHDSFPLTPFLMKPQTQTLWLHIFIPPQRS